MTLWPLCPAQIHHRASGRWSMQSGGFRSDDATGGIAAAFEVDELSALNGIVALDHTRYARRLWGISLVYVTAHQRGSRQGSCTDPGTAGEQSQLVMGSSIVKSSE
jgi:hypothetical protein